MILATLYYNMIKTNWTLKNTTCALDIFTLTFLFIISLRTLTFHDIRMGGSINSKTCSRRLCKMKEEINTYERKGRDLRTTNLFYQLTYETQISRLYVENEGCFEKDHFMFFGFQCSLQIFHTHERAIRTFEMPHHQEDVRYTLFYSKHTILDKLLISHALI